MLKTLLLAAALALTLAPPASAQDDVKAAPSCRHCGMDREKFATSRMVVNYEDGSSAGTCSIRCTAVELATTLDKAPRSIQVADLPTKQLIDAEKASWVVVAGKPGVMTRHGKWAFADRAAAEAYARANGGAVVSFEEAMKAAYGDLYQDDVMLREKRKMMRQKAMEHQHMNHEGMKQDGMNHEGMKHDGMGHPGAEQKAAEPAAPVKP